MPALSSLLSPLAARLDGLWEKDGVKKLRRVLYHIVRGLKKFAVGSGSTAWIVGTTMLVLVMPLAFEIEREQQALEYEMGGAAIVRN